MRPRTLSALCLAAMVAATAGEARGVFGVQDLRMMAQDADAIVRARVVGKEERSRPLAGGSEWTERFLVMEVRKVLAGECPGTVRVRSGGPGNYPDGRNYESGQVYLACLQRIPGADDAYEEMNYCHTVLRVADGRVRVPEKLRVPEDVAPRFSDRSAANWEAGLVWLRGPRVRVEPVRDRFACDAPLEFRITLTNPAEWPMTLLVGTGKWASVLYRLDLVDAGGLRVLEDAWCGPIDARDLPESAPQAREARRLAPGESVARALRARLGLSDFVQDPRTVRAAHVTYYPREAHAVRDAWRGTTCGRCPVRMTCRYGRWADDLGRPNRDWAVRIQSRYYIAKAWLIAAPDRVRLGLYAQRARPIEMLGWRGICRSNGGGGVHKVRADEERVLAACFRVQRDGRPVPGPAPDLPRLARLLERCPSNERYLLFRSVHLSRFFDFSTPGVYRVRAVLPGEDGPAASAVLRVHVPAPTDGTD